MKFLKKNQAGRKAMNIRKRAKSKINRWAEHATGEHEWVILKVLGNRAICWIIDMDNQSFNVIEM